MHWFQCHPSIHFTEGFYSGGKFWAIVSERYGQRMIPDTIRTRSVSQAHRHRNDTTLLHLRVKAQLNITPYYRAPDLRLHLPMVLTLLVECLLRPDANPARDAVDMPSQQEKALVHRPNPAVWSGNSPPLVVNLPCSCAKCTHFRSSVPTPSGIANPIDVASARSCRTKFSWVHCAPFDRALMRVGTYID